MLRFDKWFLFQCTIHFYCSIFFIYVRARVINRLSHAWCVCVQFIYRYKSYSLQYVAVIEKFSIDFKSFIKWFIWTYQHFFLLFSISNQIWWKKFRRFFLRNIMIKWIKSLSIGNVVFILVFKSTHCNTVSITLIWI